jgi:hypothetical protein
VTFGAACAPNCTDPRAGRAGSAENGFAADRTTATTAAAANIVAFAALDFVGFDDDADLLLMLLNIAPPLLLAFMVFGFRSKSDLFCDEYALVLKILLEL